MDLGKTIYELRTAKNLSQGELSDLLDVSRQSVSKWENNTATPDLDKLIKLCDIFGISLDELTGRSNPEPQQTQTVVSGKNPALTQQKIIGYILLLALILSAVIFFDNPYTTLICSVPLLLCSMICLRAKHYVGYWCAWAVYLSFEFYWVSRIGIQIFKTVLIMRPLFLAIMAVVVWFLFRDKIVPAEKKRRHMLFWGWVLHIGVTFAANRLFVYVYDALDGWRHHVGWLYIYYVINFVLIAALAGLFTYTIYFLCNWYRGRKERKNTET